MARKKKRTEKFAGRGDQLVPEGEWSEYRLIKDDDTRGAEGDPQARGAEEENYEYSIGFGEAGLGEDTGRLSRGEEEESEPAAKFDYPDQDSGFETHERVGDEAGFSPFGSENWSRQEYGFATEAQKPTKVLPRGKPVARRGKTLPYGYSPEEEPADYGRFYTEEGAPGPRDYAATARSDEEIHREICERLRAEPDIHVSDLDIEVADGVVTLRGTAESALPAYLTAAIVERVSGIRSIRDEIRLGRD